MFSKIYRVFDGNQVAFYLVKGPRGGELTTISGITEASWFAIHEDNEFIGFLAENKIIPDMLIFIARQVGIKIEELNIEYETERTLETDAYIASIEENPIGNFLFGINEQYKLLVNPNTDKDHLIGILTALDYKVGTGTPPPASGF